MREKIVIIGAGGHGREALDVARESENFAVEGFIADENPGREMLATYKTCWLGDPKYLLDKKYGYVIAIGDCKAKKNVSRRISVSSCYPVNLIHQTAYAGSNRTFGKGIMMYAGARVTTNVKLGNHVHLNANSVVSHDCSVGDFSIVCPGALLNGNVTVGEGCFIGTGAIILPKVRIGDWVVVGAGAVVTSDIPSHETYIGVPARRMEK